MEANHLIRAIQEALQAQRAKKTTRDNLSTSAVLTDDHAKPWAEGSFFYVVRGRYTNGTRQGKECVAKWFKTGVVFEDEFYAADLNVVKVATYIITEWNKANFISSLIRLNQPAIWEGKVGSSIAGQRMLVEPLIQNYTKFNSNTGWVNQTGVGWNDCFQALSHFSYHLTSGQYLLCDLQGGVYNDGAVLTDPVVHSRDSSCGPADLGVIGMSSFFMTHRCNQYCKSEWKRPASITSYYTPQEGTTMIANGGAVGRGPQGTGIAIPLAMAPPPRRLANGLQTIGE